MNKIMFFSKETEKIIDDTIKKGIEQVKDLIDVNLVKAIISVESNWNPFAIRFEPELKNTRWYTNSLKNIENITDFHFCSFGLMQVLYGVALNLGYTGNPLGLFDPITNIHYGTSLLLNYLRIYKNIKDAISSYNQGSPKKDKDGKYLNQAYVDKVCKAYLEYGGKL